ncbi:MAG: sugar transferase [Lentisphaeria bacterium]|nr:sugar transferase [Lentisphaeria bacterium]MBQ8755823.1 sugar transferase [Lentisphaeria bacterium]MBQ9774804.1 sugar transferase [Lentisphaeria bacterium]
MTQYEEILALRQELKRPSVFRHNHIQLRMLVWNITIGASETFKRFMDIVLAVMALILGSPIFLFAALLVKGTSPGPIIFSQIRVGRYGRHFRFYKFRSMYIDAEARKAELLKQNESADGVIFKMKYDPRITPVGRFIRKFSIDELPQLFNVILGDMSLVGPRPPLPSEVRTYSLEERKRLNVTPGITCLWQVSGRSELPFSRQIALDKEYIASRSAWKDFLILLKTVPAILTGKGAW